MNAAEPLSLHLATAGGEVRVVGVEPATVWAETPLALDGPRGRARLAFRQGAVGACVDVEVERLPPADTGRAGVPYRLVGPRNAIVVLGRMASGAGRERFRPALDLEGPPRSARDPRGGRDRRLVAAFVAATVLFGAVAAWQVDRRLSGFDAEIARVVSDGEVVRADKAGRVVFLTGEPEVAAGEPVAGVRTRSGYEQPFLSPIDGRVAAVLARTGEDVAVGDPVVLVSRFGESPHVVARLSVENAVRIASGYEAEVTFADGETRRVPVRPTDVVPLRKAGTAHRVDVRISAGDDLGPRLGEPVDVRFVARRGGPERAAGLSVAGRAVTGGTVR